jgi:hypothetical protein
MSLRDTGDVCDSRSGRVKRGTDCQGVRVREGALDDGRRTCIKKRRRFWWIHGVEEVLREGNDLVVEIGGVFFRSVSGRCGCLDYTKQIFEYGYNVVEFFVHEVWDRLVVHVL